MRRLGAVLLALAVTAAATSAPARAVACGGRPAIGPGCCCKDKAPAPAKPCCEAAPATSDEAVLSGMTGIATDLLAVASATLPELPALAQARPPEAIPATSSPGSPPVFLLGCTFRI